MPLTDTAIRRAKPKPKPYKLTDGDGLHIEITPSGSKLWRLRYRRSGRETTMALGKYPAVGLRQARERAKEARAQLSEGSDPVTEKRRQSARQAVCAGDTFADLARAYMASRPSWAPGHAARFRHRMERDVYDVLGGMHPAKILPIDVIAAVRPIAKRGAMDTAKRVVGMIGQVMRHGVVLGLCPADPTIGLAAALGDAPPPRHRPALIDPAAVGAFQRAVAAVETPTIAKPLLQMIALTAQRPGEVRRMEWSQVDAARKEWTFDVTKTATAAHIVPLSQPALDLLDAMRARTGRGRYVFASGTDRPVSDVAASQFIRRLRYGDRMSAHGWRATFRTVAVETLGHPEAIVEMHIAHAVRDAHGRAYNRTQWHAERHVLVGDWARWLADAERKALDLSASLR